MGRGLAGDVNQNLPFGFFANSFMSEELFIMQGRVAPFPGKGKNSEAGKYLTLPDLVSTLCQLIAFHSKLRRDKSAHMQLLKRKQGEPILCLSRFCCSE